MAGQDPAAWGETILVITGVPTTVAVEGAETGAGDGIGVGGDDWGRLVGRGVITGALAVSVLPGACFERKGSAGGGRFGWLPVVPAADWPVRAGTCTTAAGAALVACHFLYP